MTTFRKERMGEAIRKVVSEKITRDGLQIPQGMVTINRVDVAPDYGVAKIFYSIFGADVNEREAETLMKEHQREFRHEISQKLNLRRTPKIEFCFDKNIEYAARIERLLSEESR
ncbi:MAG TPA: 30S ribosome-binding factor RbfA [Myxococcota bacterium]|nr:30S ribosome-binding factor RbfA [Myxococcota bacterium]